MNHASLAYHTHFWKDTTMAKIEVYDPPMCCSTGVCGPDPDEQLARFSADLAWLKGQGVEVRRYNLSQEPQAFTSQPEVLKIVNQTNGKGLPIVMLDGQIVAQGAYPSRQKLMELAGLSRADAVTLPTSGGCCGGSNCC